MYENILEAPILNFKMCEGRPVNLIIPEDVSTTVSTERYSPIYPCNFYEIISINSVPDIFRAIAIDLSQTL